MSTLTGQDRCDDYTGRALPGVYLLEPSEDNFSISLRRRGELQLDVTRIQFPLAPSAAGTFNNSQGKTVRGQGHTIDCTRPSYFGRDVYIQHLYMILGRAQSLQYSLFRNFPTLENGDVDWSFFENGPPQYIADFLDRLEAGKSMKMLTRWRCPRWRPGGAGPGRSESVRLADFDSSLRCCGHLTTVCFLIHDSYPGCRSDVFEMIYV